MQRQRGLMEETGGTYGIAPTRKCSQRTGPEPTGGARAAIKPARLLHVELSLFCNPESEAPKGTLRWVGGQNARFALSDRQQPGSSHARYQSDGCIDHEDEEHRARSHIPIRLALAATAKSNRGVVGELGSVRHGENGEE